MLTSSTILLVTVVIEAGIMLIRYIRIKAGCTR